MKKILWSVLLLGFTHVALMAQAPGDVATSRAEMKKLDWLVGSWKGAGWILMGPQGRKEFTQTEIIQSKLGGLLLLIEGTGKSKEDGSIIHNALAFVRFDGESKTYRWRSFTAEGRGTDTDAKVGDGSLEWGYEIPGRGQFRYILKQTENGEWFEIGEMSRDGQTWRKFFEMTLQKEK